ncbi:tyrosine-type recombinase/integrase [Terribacillus saccharophilus]|uniref:tyrosine-type recombinase/integrase n=1 Tax=Terribacillus saccharophilus TaxID=361277 RepID=UPI000C9CE7B4|nr:tyrosine-type recombinase/integrase [Terribacillus goriensis]
MRVKLIKTKKDPDLYYYFNSKNIKMWCFRYRYYDALGKRKEKSKQGFETENAAYRALLQVKQDIIDGEVRKVDYSNITVAQWLDIWYETKEDEWKITSRLQRQNAIKYQMKPLLGKYKLAELDKATYKRAYINVLAKKYKPSSVILFHKLFKVAVNAAVDNEILTRNRFNNIKIEQEEAADNFLTAEELDQLISAAEQLENITNYTLLLTLSYTGVRKGEAQGFRWTDFDPEKSTISVNRTRDNKGVRSPKTKRSIRTIYISDRLTAQLKKYKIWCKSLKLSFGKSFSEDEYIFLSHQTGEAITDNKGKYALDRLIKKLEIKRISIHGLRHTHASILVSKGVPVPTIAKRLGNTAEMINNVYGHSYEAMEMQTVNVFDDSLKSTGVPSGGHF